VNYSATVRDHFHNPRHAYRMADPDRVGVAGVPGRGPFMLIFLRLDGERIEEASFQTYGCPPAIAAASLLVESLSGSTLEAAEGWTDEARIRAALGGLPAHKHHCARLAAEAVASALATAEQERS